MKIHPITSIISTVLVTLLNFLNPTVLFSQILTPNDGFEGQQQKGVPPPYWYNCDEVSSADTQPGFMNNYKPASEGKTYISLVSRELGPPGTVETVWAELKKPFMKDSCYKISLDLSLSKEFYGTYNWETYYFDNPCILQIIGFNGDCEFMGSSEILWESNALTNYDWEIFNITINPLLDSYNRIALRANFTPPENHQNSVVFIDNLKIQDTTNVLIKDDLGLFTLLPEWASNIQWYYNGEILEGETSHNLPFVENGDYFALFRDENGCLLSVAQRINFNYNYVSLYPNPTSDNVTLYFYSATDELLVFAVYNDLGQLVLAQEHLANKGINKVVFNLDALARGIYFIKTNDLLAFPKSLKVVVQ